MSAPIILIVDDDRTYCVAVAAILARRGYRVETASDGDGALNLIKQRPYSLVVLDYRMPGMDGVELFVKAREFRPDLQGIFLTAYASINTVFPAIHAGAARVLAKPINADELVGVVEEMVGAVPKS